MAVVFVKSLEVGSRGRPANKSCPRTEWDNCEKNFIYIYQIYFSSGASFGEGLLNILHMIFLNTSSVNLSLKFCPRISLHAKLEEARSGKPMCALYSVLQRFPKCCLGNKYSVGLVVDGSLSVVLGNVLAFFYDSVVLAIKSILGFVSSHRAKSQNLTVVRVIAVCYTCIDAEQNDISMND